MPMPGLLVTGNLTYSLVVGVFRIEGQTPPKMALSILLMTGKLNFFLNSKYFLYSHNFPNFFVSP